MGKSESRHCQLIIYLLYFSVKFRKKKRLKDWLILKIQVSKIVVKVKNHKFNMAYIAVCFKQFLQLVELIVSSIKISRFYVFFYISIKANLFLMKHFLWLFNIGGKVPQILLKKVSYLANSRDLYFTWYSCTFISCIVGELSWKLQHCWIKGQPCIYFSRVIPMVSPPSLDAHLAFLNFLSFYSNEFDPWFHINVYLILSVTKGSFQI